MQVNDTAWPLSMSVYSVCMCVCRMWVHKVSIHIWRCLCLTEVVQECPSYTEIITIFLYLLQWKQKDISNNPKNPRNRKKLNPRMLCQCHAGRGSYRFCCILWCTSQPSLWFVVFLCSIVSFFAQPRFSSRCSLFSCFILPFEFLGFVLETVLFMSLSWMEQPFLFDCSTH